MYGKAINVNEASRVLKNNGFELNRIKGGHLIFRNEDGNIIVITNNKLSQKTWKRVCKENSIKGD